MGKPRNSAFIHNVTYFTIHSTHSCLHRILLKDMSYQWIPTAFTIKIKILPLTSKAYIGSPLLNFPDLLSVPLFLAQYTLAIFIFFQYPEEVKQPLLFLTSGPTCTLFPLAKILFSAILHLITWGS